MGIIMAEKRNVILEKVICKTRSYEVDKATGRVVIHDDLVPAVEASIGVNVDGLLNFLYLLLYRQEA
jgi:hypothetical protein